MQIRSASSPCLKFVAGAEDGTKFCDVKGARVRGVSHLQTTSIRPSPLTELNDGASADTSHL